MDVIPSILGDTEFSEFTTADYCAFRGVLNEAISVYIKRYMSSPDANPNVVVALEENIGTNVYSFVLPKILEHQGVFTMLETLNPEVLVNGAVDLDATYKKLLFLEDNYDKLLFSIQPRTSAVLQSFVESLEDVLARLYAKGIEPTYPDIIKRVNDNRFLFYDQKGKVNINRCSIVNKRLKQWKMCLKGIKYLKYCEENDVNVFNRRSF